MCVLPQAKHLQRTRKCCPTCSNLPGLTRNFTERSRRHSRDVAFLTLGIFCKRIPKSLLLLLPRGAWEWSGLPPQAPHFHFAWSQNFLGYSKQPLPLKRETSDIFIYTLLQVSNCCMTITSGRHLTQKTREVPAGAKCSSRCSDKNPNLRTAPGPATRPKPSQRNSQCLVGGLYFLGGWDVCAVSHLGIFRSSVGR